MISLPAEREDHQKMMSFIGQPRINIKSYLVYNPAERRSSVGLSCLKKTASHDLL